MAAGKTTLVEELLAATGTIPRAGSVTAGTTVCDHDADARRQQRSVSPAVALARPPRRQDQPDRHPGLPGLPRARSAPACARRTPCCSSSARPTSPRARRADLGAARGVPPRRAPGGAGARPPRPRAGRRGGRARGRAGRRWRRTGEVLVAGHPHRARAPTAPSPCTRCSTARRPRPPRTLDDAPPRARRDPHRAGRGRGAARALDRRRARARRPRCARPSPAPSPGGPSSPSSGCARPAGAGPRRAARPRRRRRPAARPRTRRCPRTPPTAPGTTRWPPTRTGRWSPRSCTPAPTPRAAASRCVRVFSGRLRPDSVADRLRRPAAHPRAARRRGPDRRRRRPAAATARVTRVYAPLGATLREVPWCVAGDLCALTRPRRRRHRRHPLRGRRPRRARRVGAARGAAPGGRHRRRPLRPGRHGPRARAPGRHGDHAARRAQRGHPPDRAVVHRRGARRRRARPAAGRRGRPSRSPRWRSPSARPSPGPRRGLGRHVKQSGGHGQFAVCRIEIEPLPRGSGVEFVDRIVGGAIPRAYIPGVEKGVRAQLDAGVTPGPPRRRRAGHAASTARRTASTPRTRRSRPRARSRCARRSPRRARCVMARLYEVEVTVDDGQLGAVLGDLAARHGRVVGTEPDASRGAPACAPRCPEQALLRYAVDLRALTVGDGVLHPPVQPLRAGRRTAGKVFPNVRSADYPPGAHRSRGSPR